MQQIRTGMFLAPLYYKETCQYSQEGEPLLVSSACWAAHSLALSSPSTHTTTLLIFLHLPVRFFSFPTPLPAQIHFNTPYTHAMLRAC